MQSGATATTEWMETEGDWSFLLRGSRLSQFEAWAADTRIVLTGEERPIWNPVWQTARKEPPSIGSAMNMRHCLNKEPAGDSRPWWPLWPWPW